MSTSALVFLTVSLCLVMGSYCMYYLSTINDDDQPLLLFLFAHVQIILQIDAAHYLNSLDL